MRRVNSLEAPQVVITMGPALGPGVLGRPPPIASAAPAPPLKRIDLNFAPGSSSHSPVMDEERPKGHGEHCGGIPVSRPQFILEGMCIETQSVNSFPTDSVPHSPPFSKLEFS
jgi:hypothetical protein